MCKVSNKFFRPEPIYEPSFFNPLSNPTEPEKYPNQIQWISDQIQVYLRPDSFRLDTNIPEIQNSKFKPEYMYKY